MLGAPSGNGGRRPYCGVTFAVPLNRLSLPWDRMNVDQHADWRGKRYYGENTRVLALSSQASISFGHRPHDACTIHVISVRVCVHADFV